jgi:peptidoglycan/xylan/chitin deacetylase (PgdA/CDA1 family)
MYLFKTPNIFKWIFPRRIWGFSRTNNVVYLTFDDGPDPEITPWVLDFLKEQNIKACFFCVGENIKREGDLFARIKSEGHVVGNHTMRHEKGTKTRWTDYRASIRETEALVGNKLFRPPYGRIRAWQSFLLAFNYDIVMWSWLSYDYSSKISTDRILRESKKIKAGDILLLHDNKKGAERLKDLLPKLIEELRQRSFKFGEFKI